MCLYVDPELPHWLPDITLIDLRLGKHHLDMRFYRDGERTVWEVLRGDARLVRHRSTVAAGQALGQG